MKTARKGFTLIELLIVIAVLGILAIAVLAAINPIEQINRSRDTGSRSDAEQLIGAIDRFNASKGYYPWMTSATDDEITGWIQVGAGWTDGTNEVLDNLSSAGTEELKSSFVTRIQAADANPLYVYNGGEQGNTTYVCFMPRSGSFNEDATGRCGEDASHGSLPDDFPPSACGNTDDCGTDGFCSCLP